MTKNKNQKNAKSKNNNNNGNTTPPATPPINGGVKPPGTYANGMPRKPTVPWERELVGSFLLEMARLQVISAQTEWYVDKARMRHLFEVHLNAQPNCSEIRQKLSNQGATNIGSLLHRTNFLINTPRGNPNYRIKNFSLIDFRKEKFNLLDEQHRLQGIASTTVVPGGAPAEGNKPLTEALLAEYKLDTDVKPTLLKYQKILLLQSDKDFELNSLGCYICQENFETIEKYEEHVEYHGDESDFQSLKKMEKYPESFVSLSYQTCVDSHYFGFTLKTHHKDLVVEKFIIVQLRQFYYVYGAQMPLPVTASGELVFFVDSHVFMILREQPIVIGFTIRGQKYVEQHHFMRTEALPKASFNINPYRLSSKEIFKSKGVPPANPPTQVLSALKHEDAQMRLASFDKDYQNYCERGREITQENLSGTLRTLLQVEDIERLQHYLSLKQSKMELHQFGRELSVKMQMGTTSMSVEDILSPGDDVLIINEKGNPESGVRQMLENNNKVLELALKDFESILQWARNVDGMVGSLDRQPRVYFARVLGVSTQRVNITCERQLPDNTTYTLIFRPLRAVMRYQYRALHQLSITRHTDVQRILFPGEIPNTPLASGVLQLNNKLISSNPEQMQAVREIALSPRLKAPYIVFGPPGTGKTATIVEAIYQLYVNRPETHILVLSGSNTACDEVALRLLKAIAKAPKSQPRPLTRIFSASCDRRIDNIDDLLLEYSNMYSVHFYPAVQAVHQYRIVICTLSLAGKLSTGGFAANNVYTHVFVDEAAASTEAEVLMGITCTLSPTLNLILSGDHKQLGPVLQSQRANEWGLGLTLFERLLQRKCYQVEKDGSYNASVQTRLIRNFRSHPEIVSLYNNLYYEGHLRAEAPMEIACRFHNWFYLPNATFPIMFHSVFGTTMNTKSSVSLCNNKEIDVVMDYVKDLMYFGLNGEKLLQTDIGIISPYKNQYQRIQEQLNMRNWSQIDCGSVELFQGKEKHVIIVSFVRSFTPKLGFLNNERRLNVLLSRPISLLILIGNPRTLSQNSDFQHIIEMCRDRKTLVGVQYLNENCIPNKKSGANNVNEEGAAGDKPASGPGEPLKQKKHAKSPVQATKLFYSKKELLKLGNERQSKKSELETIFDELPKVPSFVDHDLDEVRSLEAQLNDFQFNTKWEAAGASISVTPAPRPAAAPSVMPRAGLIKPETSASHPSSAPRPAIRKPTVSAATPVPTSRSSMPEIPSSSKLPIPMSSNPLSTHKERLVNEVLCGIEVLPSENKTTRSSAYSHIPNGNLRFENVRPTSEDFRRYTAANEQRRAPPFREPHRNWSNFGWSPPPRDPTPPPSRKKSKCIIS
ncbi:DNA-binding protein SMUBP-2 isoform X2 [Drosophila mauritiana]|uniref:DNA-binding protein SMUBP-2 isoform X2 n=1 Tax=Drosophila mauritiana TaxID=7226 RepID=A0A6P8J9U0_DROMA|nr:DNA-binding protein SMUBP-2 isoform X2 [Drosophila mauritiana]